MMQRMVRQLTGLIAVAAGLLIAGSAQAQELVVRGRVIGPHQEGIAAQRVVLHRVDGSGGATIAEAASDEDGRFELRTSPGTDTTGVYFVAARYDEELYIGPPFRPTDDVVSEQIIQVGVPSMSATSLLTDDGAAGMPIGRPPASSRAWLLLIIPLLGGAGVMVSLLLSRRGIPEHRALLIRVAELDERMANATAAQRETLHDERLRLMARLREG